MLQKMSSLGKKALTARCRNPEEIFTEKKNCNKHDLGISPYNQQFEALHYDTVRILRSEKLQINNAFTRSMQLTFISSAISLLFVFWIPRFTAIFATRLFSQSWSIAAAKPWWFLFLPIKQN